jgi:NTP pyrophosphatase (non-canonical NTP hydrolase)
MSDPRFLQDGFDKRLSHVIEECGEVLAAAGKTQRWGPFSFNPLIPESERVTNLAWLKDEMKDLREAMDRLSVAIKIEYGC